MLILHWLDIVVFLCPTLYTLSSDNFNQLFFFFFKLQDNCFSVVLVSAVPESEPAVCIHTALPLRPRSQMLPISHTSRSPRAPSSAPGAI